MRTLSARILLGFAALTITFGVITAFLVNSQRHIEAQVLLMGKGYVPLALESKDLARRQYDLHQYLDERLGSDAIGVERGDLRTLRKRRDAALAEMVRVFDNLEKTIQVNPRQFKVTQPLLDQINTGVAALDLLYTQVVSADRDEPASPELLAAAAKLSSGERKLWVQTNELSNRLERYVAEMTEGVERNERVLQLRTMSLGISAVVLGMLVTGWVVITLRPLRRLREGARRIAAGDYGSRISETGPAEVADLAREFNSMGRAIEERERDLVRSERLAAVGKMAAMITHEVRNPLSSIGLNTELLEDELGEGAASEEARSLCASIHREVDRLTAITEEYLAFSRLPKPKLAAEPINAIVTALAGFVREDLAAKDVTLVTELAPGEPIAQIDPGQIRQCLINLVRNAADAVAAKGAGRVVLRTRVMHKRIEVDVEDDGIGIPPDALPKLFDPFFSTKEGGNGLGLALTQQILRDHGGELRVDSAVGRGTTFTISVPAIT